jgi:5,10-methylenetetrahydromethanopterin reductase
VSPALLPAGVNLMPTAPVGMLVELAVEAERLGFSRCWIYDEGLHTRELYVTLAAIAAATERIRIGPGITNPYTRHPGITASAIATLDELSGGRAFVGLGAGGTLTLGPLAIERRRPVAAVGATVDGLRRLFAGGPVTVDGPDFGLDRATLGYGRADIEIVVAGRGPLMTALAARVADAFVLSYVHRDLIGPAVAALRAERPLHVVYSTMMAVDDADLEEARAQLTFRLVDSPPEVRDLLGLGPGLVEELRAALAAGGPAAAAPLVRPEWVPAFVLVGTPEQCGAQLRDLMVRHDIEEFQLGLPEPEGAAERMAMLAAALRASDPR